MATAADLRKVRAALAMLTSAAEGDLLTIWNGLRTAERMAMSDALAQTWTGIIGSYGTAAAAAAADQFEEWAAELGVRPNLDVVPGVNEERALARLGWALSTPNQWGNVSGLLNELVQQPFRSTMQDSAIRSGGGWARVPSSREPCSFCIMLASRGGVYRSAETAGLGKSYHGNCSCQPVLVTGPEDYPDGYDPEELYQLYAEGASMAGPGATPAEIAAKMDEARAQRAAAAAEATAKPDAEQITVQGAPVQGASETDERPTSDWLYQSIEGDDLDEYSYEDLVDLYNEAETANDPQAMKLARDQLNKLDKQMAGYRGTGFTRAEVRQQWDEYTDRSYWDAEAQANGFLLNEEGRRAGVDPRSLFKGSEARAYKYASDELKWYWQDNPRLTFDAFAGDADARGQAGKAGF